MSLRHAAAASPLLPPALLVGAAALAAAALAGLMTALGGGIAGNRAIYAVAVLGLAAAGGLIVITRKEPLRFGFFALIACLPIASAAVPPGRLDVTVFDAVMLVLAIALIGKKIFSRSTENLPLFPSASLAIACALFGVTIAFSQYPAWSLGWSVIRFGAYLSFVFLLLELGRERGFERLVLAFSLVLLAMAAGLLIDHFLHINLSLRGSNINQMTYNYGLQIYRAGGFFQDPQKAATFVACMVSFLLLLSIRGRFRGMRMRFVVWAAILFGLTALVTTISRSAILACLMVSAATLLLFNNWGAPVKLLILCGTLALATAMAFIPLAAWVDILPAAISERFLHIREELDHRLTIWLDTWDMFADHPLTGIGPGSFKPYLIDTRPGVVNYYGMGGDEGIVYIPDQPESGYLKIFYEGGILGSLAALLVAADAIRRAILIITPRNPDPDARTEGIAALAGLVTFAITFVTLYTLGEPRIGIVFALFLAVLWHRSTKPEPIAAKV